MSHALLSSTPHRRLNALTGEWVFVSPQRTERPWQGMQEPRARPAAAAYDPQCYLCPGNARANGERNPPYASTYAFTNDFPAFIPDASGAGIGGDTLLRAQMHSGTCRVLCYSPRHDLTLAQLPAQQMRSVIELWAAQIAELGARWRWVQVFENKGEMMGASNPHPHGQVWAGDFVPNEAAKELREQRQWLQATGTPLLLEYARLEANAAERVVVQNAHWLAAVPWWAVWPFETLVLPRWQVSHLPDVGSEEIDSLGELLGRLLAAYDRLFDTSFPYSFGWHGAPTGGGASSEDREAWQLHAHFYPPLLRSATVRKFLVGYELLAEAQRDITPERAAERLREACRP